jgi:tungstate transport system substrate-binding protein
MKALERGSASSGKEGTIMAKGRTRLVIASTTSTKASGLFDILIPAYEKKSLYDVSADIVAVGTGRALRMAKKGEADVLFVHTE